MQVMNLLPIENFASPVSAEQILQRYEKGEERHFENGRRLSAYMLWPNDEEQRDLWMLTSEALSRRLAGEPVEIDPGLTPFGGLHALTDAAAIPLHEKAAKIESGH